MATIKNMLRGKADTTARTQEAWVNINRAERWISTLGGAGVATYGLVRRDWPGGFISLLGSVLLFRGISGHSWLYQALHKSTVQTRDPNIAQLEGKNGFKVSRSQTINRKPEELYAYWRQVENAPRYMPFIETVTQTGERTSHWVSFGPGHRRSEWNAEILEDQPGRVIAWHVHGQTLAANSGRVTFARATGDRGTVVTLEQSYYDRSPLISLLGELGQRLPEFETLETLRRFKEVMEAGEVPTSQGQPTGRSQHKGGLQQ